MKNLLLAVLLVLSLHLLKVPSPTHETAPEGLTAIEGVQESEKVKTVKDTKPKKKTPRTVLVKPKSKPKPPVAKPVYPKGCERYRPLISKYDWNVATMIAIAAAESGCDPNAINHTDNHGVCMGSAGLFQISCHAGLITDPAKNIAAAFGKYKSQGYAAWSVCTNGRVNCL